MSDFHIYKITTKALWEASDTSLALSDTDQAFIHFAEKDDIERIIAKFFSEEEFLVILTIDPERLIGRLVKELNPGGEREYYHLYEGSVPKAAVLAIEQRG